MSGLRPYQTKLKHDIYGAWDSGAANVLAVLPTGGGKTRTVADMVAEVNEPAAIIAHRQELVGQLSVALARERVRHGIVAPPSVVRDIVKLQIDEVGVSYFDPNAKTKVAGVDTLVRLSPSDPWLPQVRRWVTDECFPAGTPVDGRPIESIQVGDEVTAFDESTGVFCVRKVVRLFKNPAPKHMVRIRVAHHVLECTGGHPFWTHRGWVEAGRLRSDDEVLIYELPHVRSSGESDRSREADRPGLLQQDLQQCVSGAGVFQDDGGDKPEIRFCSHDGAEPHEPAAVARKDACNAAENGPFSERAGRQRTPPDNCGSGTSDAAGRSGVSASAVYQDGLSRRSERVPACVQSGYRESSIETSRGSGRKQPLQSRTSSAGCEEGRISSWHRLDSVEVFERSDFEQPSSGAGDGYVYNIEVEGLHTYTVSGVVVHNCHHVQEDNKWGKAARMFTNARGLGVTATPVRADKKGLGRGHGGIMDAMVEGPQMQELMDAPEPYLTGYDVACCPSDVDYSHVKVGSTGDLSSKGLRDAVHKSNRIVGDVVDAYLKHAAGKRGITFAVDVEEATKLAQRYNERGVRAAVIHGAMHDLERIKLMRQFRAGQLLQLCNCDILGEGVDVPAVEVVSMARKTLSYSLFAQQFGRMLRPFPGKSKGLLIDHVGNFVFHKPPNKRRIWTLEGAMKMARKKDDIPMRECPSCTRPYERFFPACPHCGFAVEPAGRSTPEQVDGDISLLDQAVIDAMMADTTPVLRVPIGARPEVLGRLQRLHQEKTHAQHTLREAISLWGGYATAEGLDIRTAQKKFWHVFGVDVLTAQALGAREAAELEQRVRGDLT